MFEGKSLLTCDECGSTELEEFEPMDPHEDVQLIIYCCDCGRVRTYPFK